MSTLILLGNDSEAFYVYFDGSVDDVLVAQPVGNLRIEVFRENVVKRICILNRALSNLLVFIVVLTGSSQLSHAEPGGRRSFLNAHLHFACVGFYEQEITHFPDEESFTSSLNPSLYRTS